MVKFEFPESLVELAPEICDFLSESNITSTGNRSLISEQRLRDFQDLSSLVVLAKVEQEIVGSIFSIPMPVGDAIYGCTTFLCLHPEHRGFGYTPTLIRKLTEVGYQKGIMHGYHTTSKKLSKNGVQLQGWYRPINIQQARDVGFHCLNIGYSRNLPSNLRVEHVLPNNLQAFQFCKKLADGRKFAYNPSLEHFNLWVKCYSTYVVYDSGSPVSMFSLNRFIAKIEKTQKYVSIDQLCLTMGRGDHSLSGAISVSDSHVVIGYLVGGIQEHHLRKELCIISTDTPWLSIYNDSREIKKEEIHVPLI